MEYAYFRLPRPLPIRYLVLQQDLPGKGLAMTGGKSPQAKCDGSFEWKLFEETLCLLPDLIKHLCGQASGLCVLQAGVIGT